MAGAILAQPDAQFECQNGSSHSSTQILQLAVPQLLELKYCIYGRARMAQAIMALQYCWQYQNGSSRSCTQVMQLSEPEWLKPLWHSIAAVSGKRQGNSIRAKMFILWESRALRRRVLQETHKRGDKQTEDHSVLQLRKTRSPSKEMSQQ